MRLALIGNGGVGKAFVQLLLDKSGLLRKELMDVQMNYVLDSKGGIYNPAGIDLKRLAEFNHSGLPLMQFPGDGSDRITFDLLLANGGVDVVVELTPSNLATGEPGMTHIASALQMGWHVITGNKGPVMLAWHDLNRLAASKGVKLMVGCTTGGALPAINGGMIDLAGAEILSIEGVLNGTTNFILEEMEHGGYTYEEALVNAQAAGIAETNPSQDVEGWDTSAKLLILSNILMNESKSLQDVAVKGITALTPQDIQEAARDGLKIKLVGRASYQDDQLIMTVRPEALPPDHPLSHTNGKNKAVRFVTDTLGELMITGGASGTRAAAAAILRDVLFIHRMGR
ncbi:MAG: homoserine dehydrogenase [Bacillota bacterium]|nr:homoserine dehydrogenase [Bacillota bacterium]MDW7677055.1 homoserine dehydrogenase [Bacillota bacterium]